jgi:RNA polymerase sigma-70 factor (ECF subfamily)
LALELQSCSDEELAAKAQAGSFAAFEGLVTRYERRIYGFVVRFCRNATDAGEITQDTFVRAFQAIAQFDPRHTFAAWLFTIARRKCIDHHRAAPPAADEPLPDLADTGDPAEALASQEERQNLWHLARRALPDLQFQALWLRYGEDLDVAQTARVLRKTRTHVKVLLFRARQTLARELEGSLAGAGHPRTLSELPASLPAAAPGKHRGPPPAHLQRLELSLGQLAASTPHASRDADHVTHL